MGLYHDILKLDRRESVDYDIYVDNDFIILLAPNLPDNDYYDQVIKEWENFIKQGFES